MRKSRLHLLLLLGVIFTFPACQSEDDGGGNGTDTMDLPNVIVSQNEFTVTEGNGPTTDVVVTLSLDGTPVGASSVQAASRDVSTTAGEDYDIVNQRVFFGTDGTAEITVKVFGDLNREEDESFELIVSGGSNVAVGEEVIRINIINDDTEDNPYSIPTDGVDGPSAYDGLTLVWADEFDTPSSLTQNYVHDLGSQFNGWGNNELQFYQEENAIIGDGHLIITAKEEDQNGFDYTSSRIKTKDIFEFTHGRVDVRAALPEGQGIWPAIWMLGANIDEVSWPRCGEIDIMEMLGHEPNTLHGTVHFGQDFSVHQFIGNSVDVPLGLNGRFNVFSIIWTDQFIEWRLNDEPYHRVERNNLGSNWVFDAPQFFLFNIAVGGNWPGSPNSSTQFPQRMFIDYVRVYQ